MEESLGRRLGEDLHADGPWPSTDRSAMDGFALATGGGGVDPAHPYPVVGAALAGHPFAGAVDVGSAVRIMTGAVVPPGADTVVPVELVQDGYETAAVRAEKALPAGANIRPEGSEHRKGDLLLERGRRIRAAELGALAVLGRAQVPVFRRPRVAILATGDEVVPLGTEPAAHQVRDSNSYALAAQVRECGGEPLRLGIAKDDRDSLHRALSQGLEEADVLLTIGGVSKGTHDLVHGLLAELGVEKQFHGVALKPGKPTFFGRVAEGAFVFGLPGNPASCFTVFDLFVRPLLGRLAGGPADAPGQARIAGEPFKKNWRSQAVPARLRLSADGTAAAELTPPSPSGDPFALTGGDGYALLPGDALPSELGQAPFVPYSSGSRLS